MTINAKTQNKVFNIIMETVTDEPTSWGKIVEAVKAKVEIKNWLDVRGVLQFCINENKIQRIKNVMKEEYIKN